MQIEFVIVIKSPELMAIGQQIVQQLTAINASLSQDAVDEKLAVEVNASTAALTGAIKP
jgi:hypothetical protein